MTPKGFSRAFLAYLFSSVTILILAGVLWALLSDWLEGLRYWVVAGALWSLSVGVSSVGWSTQQVSKTLGVKPTPQLAVGSWRSVPVFGGAGAVLTDAVRTAIPGNRKPVTTIDVPEQWGFLCGCFVFPEDQVKELLRKGWSRQRRGRAAFARSHWLEKEPFHGDRDHYESWCSVAEAGGFLINRKPRHSGRMVMPPVLALSELKHKVRRVQLN